MLYVCWRLLKWIMGIVFNSLTRLFKSKHDDSSDDDEDKGDLPRRRNRYLHRRDDSIVYPKRKPKLVDFDGVEPWERALYRAIRPVEHFLLWILLNCRKGDTDPAQKLREFDTALEREFPSLCPMDDWVAAQFDKIRLAIDNPGYESRQHVERWPHREAPIRAPRLRAGGGPTKATKLKNKPSQGTQFHQLQSVIGTSGGVAQPRNYWTMKLTILWEDPKRHAPSKRT